MIGLQTISKLKIKVRKRIKTRIEVLELQIPKNVKRNNYVNDNKEDFGYNIIEKCLVPNNLLFTPSIEEYSSGNRPLKRQLITYAYYILQWTYEIKFAIISLINKPWIYTLLAEPLYILGKDRLPVMMYALFNLLAIVAQQTSITFERNMKFEFLSLVIRMKNNQNIYQLNDKYSEKFSKNFKLIFKMIIKPLWIAGILLNVIPYGYISIEAYFNSRMNFSAIGLMINYVFFTIIWYRCISIVRIVLVIYVWTVLYLKYNFDQIREKVQHCVKTANSKLIIDAIREHNYFTGLTKKLNQMLCIGLGINYFCGTPGVDILLHLSIYSENLYLRSRDTGIVASTNKSASFAKRGVTKRLHWRCR